jgi:hypothetical protein
VSRPRSVLLLCRTTRAEAGNVAEHIGALEHLSRHDVRTFNPVDRPDAAALLDLDEFDVVVIHYTIVATLERYLPAVLRDKIARFRGLKVQFVQDEYRWIDAVTAGMRQLGIGVLFTCVPERELPKVYGDRVPGLRTVATLPGYVPDALVGEPVPPLAERPVDVGYRGRTVPHWLGRLGHEKVEIGRGFLARAAAHGFRCDISSAESDRIYGEAWYRFVASCKATLGTESGASIADYDGSIERAVKEYLVRHPNASFAEVERELLAPHEGNVTINTISSRMFEAAALRTAMVLFPGDYSGAIEPWTHYIPLEKDFSNMADVLRRLRDVPFLDDLTERAYVDVVASGRFSLRRFVAEFDELVEREAAAGAPSAKPVYVRARRRSMLSGRLAVSALRRTAGRAAQPVALGALIARDPDVRRFAVGHPSAALFRDLWRIAALRRAVRKGVFAVESQLEERGCRLVLTSRPLAPAGTATVSVGAVRSAIERGTLAELVWNHSLVGEAVALVGERLVPTIVGDHGVRGAYAFGPLVGLAGDRPDLGLAVLAPFLGGDPSPEDGHARPAAASAGEAPRDPTSA